MFNYKNKLGEIHFSHSIINKIVTEAIENCDGKVEILNYKGRYMNVVPGIASRMNLYDEEAGGIQVKEEKSGLVITVYVIIHFGTSIKKATGKIIDYIYDNMEKKMGEKPRTVKIIVTGTLSKNIVKRHIEVSR